MATPAVAIPVPYVRGLLSARRQTPFLVVSRPRVAARVTEFHAGGAAGSVFFAVKANPDPGLVSFLSAQGVGFEVSAQPELDMLLRHGVDASRIITSNPIKSPAFIRRASRVGIDTFVADSEVEMEKLQLNAPGSAFLVRLTVDNAGSEWPLDKKFGLEPEAAQQVAQRGAELGLRPEGITFHVGSQCTDVDSWAKALDKVAELWQALERDGMRLGTLNLGGGFPIVYRRDVPTVPQVLEVIANEVRGRFPTDVSLQFEPGRALVGDAGTLVSRVIGKARRGEEEWLYLDVGVFNGLMESTGGIKYEFLTTAAGPERPWVVAGPTCDSVDVVAKDVWMPEPDIGDYVFIPSAGAYTTAYSSRFNGARMPTTHLVDEG